MNNLGGLALQGELAPLAVGGAGIAPVAAPPIPVEAARGGAGIVYPPVPIQVDATRITTFTQYYNDHTKDPYHGNYERVMARFNPGHNRQLPYSSKWLVSAVTSRKLISAVPTPHRAPKFTVRTCRANMSPP